MEPVTPEEIKKVIFQIPDQKAPGPDGYSSKFFKDSWDIIGEEVSQAVMDFFQSGRLLKQVNTTLITLIPKVERPETVLQYRPIACCNVVYKCISKILCRRLANVLPDLISQTQGGFIKGRSIMENILICQDLIRLYERKSISPRCMFKIDLQKAYDTVEWDFLEQMLNALKFPRKFSHWIMQCVTSASYSLNLNGNIFGFFKGQRGLRQGDPLSPLLFTVCMEYLSRLLHYTTDKPGFTFHPLCKPMKLSHMMFADDLLLFCKGDVPSMMTLLRTFATFSQSSGLKMSKGKSNAYFNGVGEGVKNDIIQISGMVEGQLPFRYLGVPIKTTRLDKKDCQILIEKVVIRIRGLGARKLSYAGRLVLVQSVLKTFHNYWASMFILPRGVITKIEAICRNFLWDGGTEFLRSPLVSWDKCCKPKKEGGLGLTNDTVWNKAAVGKMVWWVIAKADRLWVKWINHIYLKDSDWIEYTPKANSSWSWRKICQAKEALKQAHTQHIWRVDTGPEYTIARGYEYLRAKGEVKRWSTLIWGKLTIPKHTLISWTAFHNNMNTNGKLHRLGISEDDTCCLCRNEVEEITHLFFECEYSRIVLTSIGNWMEVHIPYQDTTRWRLRLRGSKLKKNVLNACINACVYHIWIQRNTAKYEMKLINPLSIVQTIKEEMKHRARAHIKFPVATRDARMVEKLSGVL